MLQTYGRVLSVRLKDCKDFPISFSFMNINCRKLAMNFP